MVFRILLEYGADPVLTDVHERNSMMYACALSLKREVELLIKDCDYDLHATDIHGDTMLHVCAKTGNTEVLRHRTQGDAEIQTEHQHPEQELPHPTLFGHHELDGVKPPRCCTKLEVFPGSLHRALITLFP